MESPSSPATPRTGLVRSSIAPSPTAGRRGERRSRLASCAELPGLIGVFRYDHELAMPTYPKRSSIASRTTSISWRINVLAFAARSTTRSGPLDRRCGRRPTALLEDPRDRHGRTTKHSVVLALVRGRRGDPGAREALQGAHGVGVSPEEFFAIVGLAAAEAELAWLEGNLQEVDRVTAPVLTSASTAGQRRKPRVSRTGAGLPGSMPARRWSLSGPYAADASGEWREAAARWTSRGLSIRDRACALGDRRRGRAQALPIAICQELGARPLAAKISRRLRELGANGVPRGPRPSTRENAAQLTARRGGGPGTGLRGSAERRDRGSTGRLPTNGRPPRLGDPPQARRAYARRGGRDGRTARRARR